MQIPHLAPTGAQSKQRKLCYMSAFLCLLKKTKVSNAPPLGQQTAARGVGHNPLPYPMLGVVGRDNYRRITRYHALVNAVKSVRSTVKLGLILAGQKS